MGTLDGEQREHLRAKREGSRFVDTVASVYVDERRCRVGTPTCSLFASKRVVPYSFSSCRYSSHGYGCDSNSNE